MTTCKRCGSEVSSSDVRCAKCGQDLSAKRNDLIGKCLDGKYRLEEHLGSGGMCDVYLATHEGMGKKVAVKLLIPALAADATIVERFEQEARAASRIHHPHAINVMDYGIAEGNVPFIVMEFIRGVTLGELLRTAGPLTVERAANILRQAAGALSAAHSVGVIHRDIKPDNIIIAEYDGSDWVEVVDFGVAKVQEDLNRRASLTGANIIVGTPRYMSPEQCEEKPVDARSDIYSLGIVLYEMLSGEAPFKGDSSTRLLVAHAQEPPEPLRNKRPDLSPELEAVVMSALEKNPSLRPQEASEFAIRFQEAAGLGQPAISATSRAGAFSRISVPLGEKEEADRALASASAEQEPDDSEATLVRPRSVSAQAQPSDAIAQQSIDSQQRPSTPPPGVLYAQASHGYRKQSNTAGVVALVVVLLAVAGVAAYMIFGIKGFGRNSMSEEVIEAQQAVTEAIARVDSLPKDHPLRSYLLDLRQWQGELKAYQEVQDDNPQITEKAERYKLKAEDITGQVRAAQAALVREPAAPSNGNAHSSNAPPAGTEPKAKESETGDATDADEEEETGDEEEATANKNTSKPRRAEPPVIEPVKPPSESEPKNSNRRNKNEPPNIEKVGPAEELHP